MIKENNLREDMQKCMVDPIYDICKNFSLEKSKIHYEKWAVQWAMNDYQQNPADKLEEVSFAFANLNDLSLRSIEAQNLYINMKRQDYIKGCEWHLYWQNVVVSWHRLKTFDEWLHDWLKDALEQHNKCPEDWIRKMYAKDFGWYLSNVDIHLFVEWKIDEEVLKRLSTYEAPQAIEDRDIEKDIEEAKKALEDIEECNKKKDVTVLTLKV